MEEKIDTIKNALREVLQILVQRGEPISDEVKTMLAQVMEHAASRIQQLREEQQQQNEPALETAEQ
jgi:polyhydroxyalkanoate synthesis regulator phasin